MIKDAELASGETLSTFELAKGIYYRAAIQRYERGVVPQKEELEHAAGRAGVLEEVAPPSLVDELAAFLPLANFAYATSKAEAEWQAQNHGYRLVVSRPEAGDRKPAFLLMVTGEDADERVAVVSIKGTTELLDMVTNCNSTPVEFEGDLCHKGMLEAAKWLEREQGLGECLALLESKGFRIVLCGHSLGAGCAILLGVLLRHRLKTTRVLGYATPPCVGETLAGMPWIQKNVLNLVLRDDMIPRCSVANAAVLNDELSARRVETKRNFKADFKAFRNRLSTLWAPAARQKKLWEKRSFDGAPAAATAPAPVASVEGIGPDVGGSTDGSADIAGTAAAEFDGSESNSSSTSKKAGPRTTILDRVLDALPHWAQWRRTVQFTRAADDGEDSAAGNQEPRDEASGRLELNLLKRVPGPLTDVQRERAEFLADLYDPPTAPTSPISPPPTAGADLPDAGSETVIDTEQRVAVLEAAAAATATLVHECEKRVAQLHARTTTVLGGAGREYLGGPRPDQRTAVDHPQGRAPSLEFELLTARDAEATRMVPPGKIVHVYYVCGILRAALIDHWYDGLRRLEVCQNAIEDHSLFSLLEAMRSVRAARAAPSQPPAWQSMASEPAQVCAVCFHSITWNRTSSTETERMYHMHHCRSCGSIVCDACSSNKMSLPAIGIIKEARVCDCCYWRGFG